MEKKWYTIAQAADFLQCSVSTVRRRISSGELAVMKSGRLIRIAESDLQAMMNRETNPKPPQEKKS